MLAWNASLAPGLGAELDVVQALLIETAAGAALLVVGRSGHGGFSEMLRLRSVARACIEHAPCPVVVVPAS
jgi:nucleotide-binding universal stress UspA family protein